MKLAQAEDRAWNGSEEAISGFAFILDCPMRSVKRKGLHDHIGYY